MMKIILALCLLAAAMTAPHTKKSSHLKSRLLKKNPEHCNKYDVQTKRESTR